MNKDAVKEDEFLRFIEDNEFDYRLLDKLKSTLDVKQKERILEDLQPDDLNDLSPDSFVREIYEVSGLEMVKILFTHHEGMRGYIPMLSSLRPLVKRYIANNYKILTKKELSLRTGVHPELIGKYINEIKAEKQQTKLF